MIKYKLTDRNMRTYGGFQWKIGEWKEAKGDIDKDLCSDAWLHCYDSPLLAVLHNSIHANINKPRLFEVEVAGESKDDNGLKRGFRRMKLVKEIELPEITDNQRIRYGILCAKKVYLGVEFNDWADKWLSGIDRSKEATRATRATGATRTTEAAVWAAEAAVWAAEAAAEAAVWAAGAAATGVIDLNLVAIAEEAMKGD